ncbi:tRNA (cytidine(34)-2'-O)-methyltransferase [Guggenheimella bovis]
MIHVVLFEPDIPQNTGNIARTCALTQSVLHLIRPLGFSMDQKTLKRSGLDYWDKLELQIHDDFESFYKLYKDLPMYLLTTKATSSYTEESFGTDVVLVFGSEASGAPDWLHEKLKTGRITIPMFDREGLRSLNLSNSVAIVLYEVLRQQGRLQKGKIL